MKVVERKGDLFTYPDTVVAAAHSDVWLGHGVNCVGRMSAGIALEFARRFPGLEKSYKTALEHKWLVPGGCWLFFESDVMIANLATQVRPGREAKVEMVIASLASWATLEVEAGEATAIAIPHIGCGIGGLDWQSQVKPAIQNMGYDHVTVFAYSL